MGMCASADGEDEYGDVVDPLEANEKAATEADKLADVKEDAADIVDARKQMIKKAYASVFRTPPSKPAFDPEHPENHLKKDAEIDEHENEDQLDKPMEGKPDMGNETDGETDGAATDGEESDDDDPKKMLKKRPPPATPAPRDMFPPTLEETIELCGNVEVWGDIKEFVNTGLDDIDELLARAGEEGDSEYPFCQAHFNKSSMATQGFVAPPEADDDSNGDGAVKKKPAKGNEESNVEFEYVAGIVGLRRALSYFQRVPEPLKMALAMDIADLYFHEDAPPGSIKRTGIDLSFARSHEDAVTNLGNMSDFGVKARLNRLEDILLAEIIPMYFEAYEEAGNKEFLVYPEEQEIMDRNYPAKNPDDDEDSDDPQAINQLDVIVVKAQNVKPMDGGTCNPYCELKVGDEEGDDFTTNIRKKTLDPMWEQSFSFEVDPEEREHENLEVRIKHDCGGDGKLIGVIELPLKNLVPNAPGYVEELYPICHHDTKKPDSKGLGAVYLKMRFGEPREEGELVSQDNIFAPKLCHAGFPLTLYGIQRAATKIANARRVQLAVGHVKGCRANASAAASAQEKAVIKVQKAWRNKIMWRKVIGFKKKMSAGGLFQKYSTGGKPELRQVYCEDGKQIHWRKKGSSWPGSFISVSEVKAVVLGRFSKNFKLHDEKKAPPAHLVNSSFSIIAESRSLDLECANERERTEWLETFSFLLRDQLKDSALVLLKKGGH